MKTNMKSMPSTIEQINICRKNTRLRNRQTNNSKQQYPNYIFTFFTWTRSQPNVYLKSPITLKPLFKCRRTSI